MLINRYFCPVNTQRLLTKIRISNNLRRLISFSSIDTSSDLTRPKYEIDLPGVENYGFEGESSFMRCKHGAVASDSEEASKVGRRILNLGGSAVDAAIAVLLCVGVHNCHSTGIGGGFLMNIYDVTKQECIAIDAREAAPSSAHQRMFVDGNPPPSSVSGGLSIGIPGEIAGFWKAHKRYGKLPWSALFKPAIDMCNEGFTIKKALAFSILKNKEKLWADKSMRRVFFKGDSKLVYGSGDTIYRPLLGQTLSIVAEKGPSAFYEGELSDAICEEIRSNGGIINRQDLEIYHARVKPAISVSLESNLTVYGVPPPASSAITLLILKVMDGYGLTPQSLDTIDKQVRFYHILNEVFKFAYAKRSALGDEYDSQTDKNQNIEKLLDLILSPAYAEEVRKRVNEYRSQPLDYYEPKFETQTDHGTSHCSIIDTEGNAVAATSTINTDFGAVVYGHNTGIIYNNQMDDFSQPGLENYYGYAPSPANFIKPFKRPMSSMSPILVTNSNGQVIFTAGGSGGSRIISSVAQVAIYNLWLGKSIRDAVDMPRLHQQLIPMEVELEKRFPVNVVHGLLVKGHTISGFRGGCVVQAIERRHSNELWAVSDARKGGAPDGLGYKNITKSFQNWFRRTFKRSKEQKLLEHEIQRGRSLTPR
ncbi:unnamed protein product [Rotaria socialis]|uniref:Uncharacterized protein n=1 Tax=Rotaria socialis TaxID=392032 RepID=A0A817L6L8_9BILA|nr:unnamed protein product [Rotaria socialis]CAF3370900.1 unnamed protein product [Rotaria socialis]CAF3523893.1 unnamed protein product [Rotaria socialis]CAF4138414.1 unnamed protein product [Rotaria socialis]